MSGTEGSPGGDAYALVEDTSGRQRALLDYRALKGRRLQQLYIGARALQIGGITLYAASPSGSASLSLAGDLKFKLTRDGTLNAGAGFSTTQAAAYNPSQGRWRSYLTGGDGGQGRPQAATAAWVAVPRFFDCCSLFPSRAYLLGEADTGPSGTTTAQGYYFVTEIGYNPLSNSIGVSSSQAQASSLNYPSLTPAASRLIVSRGDQSLGFAGVEAIGLVNALVNFADPRSEQYGEVIAYPFNILSPWDPITCTQVLVTGLASTGLNLFKTNATDGTIALPSDRLSAANGSSSPAASLTQLPAGLAPFCLQWFNLQTLDAYNSFREQVSQAYNNDYLDNGYGYSDYGSFRDGSVRTGDAPQSAGAIPRPAGSAAAGGGATPVPSSSAPRGASAGDAQPVTDGASTPGSKVIGTDYRSPGQQQQQQQQPNQAGVAQPPLGEPTVRFVGDDAQDDALADGTSQPSTNSKAPVRPDLQQLLQSGASGRPLLNQTVSALAGSPAGAAVQQIINDRMAAAMQARQLASQAASLRAEAVLRVIVRVASAGSPLASALMDVNDAWYKGAAKLSNAAVDAAIRRLEAGLPQQVRDGLRQRADAMAVQLLANMTVQAAQGEQQVAGSATGMRGL